MYVRILGAARTSPMQSERIPVWDLPVRLAHWLLVLAVAGSWLTHYGGTAWFAWHRRCGYAVLLIVAFRIVWGFVGTPHARSWLGCRVASRLEPGTTRLAR
jgi:cytochrome b